MIYITEILIRDNTGECTAWAGPNIVARSQIEARQILIRNGLRGCRVLGELVGEVEADDVIRDIIQKPCRN